MKEIALVYLLGGLSQRFGGGIKPLAPVGKNNEPLLEVSLQQAFPAHFSRIIFIVSPITCSAYQKHFGLSYRGTPIDYALQTYDPVTRDKPWGTADALCVAAPFLKIPFIICNGDDLYGASSFEQAHAFLQNTKDHVLIGYQLKEVVPDVGTVNRALIHADVQGIVLDVHEEFGISLEKIQKGHLSGNALCSMNFFGMQLSILPEIQKKVEQFKKEQQSRTAECLLPEVVNMLIHEGKAVFRVLSAHERWIGITYLSDVERVRTQLQH